MEETISLQDIFAVIKKRIWLILTSIITTVIIAAIISYFVLTPTYESSSQFIVNQSKQDQATQFSVNDIRTNVELINTYKVIIESTAILDDVIQSLNLNHTASALKNMIQVTSEQGSQVVTIKATHTDPAIATSIANETVSVFQDKLPAIMNVDNVSVLTEAETSVNPAPVAPNPKLNIAIALVLGGMIGVGIAFLLEFLDNTITTEQDVEHHLDLPVLGVVTHIESADIRGLGLHVKKQKGSEPLDA